MDENPSDPDAIVADARARHRAGDLDAAARLYDSVLARAPDHAEALQLKGILLAQTGDPAAGLELLSRAAELAPESGPIRANLAKLRLDLGEIDAAVADYEAAVDLDPGNADLLFNLGGALALASRRDEAIAWLESVRDGGNPHVLANLGNLYRQVGRLDESRDTLEAAVAAAPDNPETQHSLGATLSALRDYAGASERYRAALKRDPGFVRAAAQLFYAALHACDWEDYPKLVENFRRLVGAESGLLSELSPLVALFLPFEQDALNRVSAARVQTLSSGIAAPVPVSAARERLRIGYLSADLGSHPVGRLLADLLPRHDPDGFDVTAFTLTGPDGSDAQQAIYAGVTRVEDISHCSPAAAAGRIGEAGIDILVDLGGFTLGARPEILAARPAPLQVGWLGYCGSMGGLNDVLLADRDVLPPEAAHLFSEAVAHLPGTFMPLNRFDRAAVDAGTRADHGLPDNGFVFCAFNAPTKIDPETFAAWMTILERVEGSVLWLREHAPETTENLRAAAGAAGIDPLRLVLAPTAPAMADHLARHRHADLFLDSFVYGAHSTAADAISQGLPVLTRIGAAMPARVGASLCRAYGLADLVADTTESYVESAVASASGVNHRDTLNAALETVDTGDGFARKLENAYRGLWRARTDGPLAPGTLVSLEGDA